MTIDGIIEKLTKLESTDRFFNLYTERQAARGSIRQKNLARYLAQMGTLSTDTLLLAEAPGYRGCRYTGIPVTSERIMASKLENWDLFGEGYAMTSDLAEGMSEMTATILWKVIEEYLPLPPLLWNTAPLHPHKPDKQDSNLTPNMEELRLGMPLISDILELFQPTRILTMGRKAQIIAEEMGLAAIPLRHPSHGGKSEFTENLLDAYEIE